MIALRLLLPTPLTGGRAVHYEPGCVLMSICSRRSRSEEPDRLKFGAIAPAVSGVADLPPFFPAADFIAAEAAMMRLKLACTVLSSSSKSPW